MNYLNYAYPQKNGSDKKQASMKSFTYDPEKEYLNDIKDTLLELIEKLNFNMATESATILRENNSLEQFTDHLYFFKRVHAKLDLDIRKTNPDLYIANESALRNYALTSDRQIDEIGILLTGFDPWNVSDKRISNCSGTVALSLHNYRFNISGKKYHITSAILPNRWRDFDSGIIEYIANNAKKKGISIILSTGMGDKSRFDNEYMAFNYRKHVDNENIDVNEKIIKIGSPPDKLYTTLPETIIDISGPFKALDYDKVPLEGHGTGGDFFCNEAFYRFAYFRDNNANCYKSGFIHLPEDVRRGNPLLNDVCETIKRTLIKMIG